VNLVSETSRLLGIDGADPVVMAVIYGFDFLLLVMVTAFLITAGILTYNRFYDSFYQRNYKRLVSDTVAYMLDEDSPPPFADVLRRRILRNVIIDMLFITKGQSVATLRKIYELNGYYKHDLSLLRNRSWHRRLGAIVRLDQWKNVSDLGEYSFLLDDRNKEVRTHALKALSLSSDAGLAVDILNHLAQSKIDLSIRYECLSRLLTFHRELILNSLKEEEYQSLAPYIMKVLGDKRDIAAVPYILEASADNSGVLQEAAFMALGKIGDPRSVSFLLGGLTASDDCARLAAVKALHQVDEDLLREHQQSLQNDPDPLVRAWTQHLLKVSLS